MQSVTPSWTDVSDQLRENTFISHDIRKQISEILLAEKREREQHDRAILRNLLRVKDGRLIPGIGPARSFRGGKGRKTSPIRFAPLIVPALTCAPNFSLIAKQNGNYTSGSSPENGVEPFAVGNSPTAGAGVVSFLEHKVYHTDTVRGEISLAGVTGFGNIPDEAIFPGKGISLFGQIVHAFQIPQPGLDNYIAIQASARISNKTPVFCMVAGPPDSQVSGLVGVMGLATIELVLYDPATGHYTNRSSSYHVFESIANQGTDSSYYSKDIIYGTRQMTAEYGQEIYEVGVQSGGGEYYDGKVDISTTCKLKSADKPIYVSVTIELFGVIMIGNENVSGIVIACQAPNSTPVISFDKDENNFTSTPFVVEEIRICGL